MLRAASPPGLRLQRPLPPHAFTTYSHLADKGVTKQRTLVEFERAVGHWGSDNIDKMVSTHGARAPCRLLGSAWSLHGMVFNCSMAAAPDRIGWLKTRAFPPPV
jgi:hypothetical protein